MKKAIIVFRSKTQVFEFADILNLYGVRTSVTSAPKEAHIGCNLALEVAYNALPTVKAALSEGSSSGLNGIYAYEKKGERVSVYRVI